MRLHHPLTVPALAEAWVLDRLAVEPMSDRDRPSLRFLVNADAAGAEAFDIQDRAGGDPDAYLPGATLAFERSWLASVARLVSVREDRADLAEDERELRARSDLHGWRANVVLIHASDEEIDHWLATYASGHPDDDGSGRWSAAIRAALAEIYADPRRIPLDPVMARGPTD